MKNKFAAIIFLILAVSMVFPQPALAEDEDFSEHLEKGIEYSKNENYDSALNELEEAVKLNPKSSSANEELCCVYVVLAGKQTNAIQRRAYFKKAEYYANKAMEILPNTVICRLLGALTCFFGRYDQSIAYYKKSMQISPSITDYNGIAEAYYYLDKYDRSIEYYTRSIAAEPDDIDAYFGIGRCYRQMKEYQQAMDYLHKVLHMNPNHAQALYNLGQVYYATNRYPEAREYFLRARDIFKKQNSVYFTKKVDEYLRKIE